jgi:hypothetical protein
MYRDSMCGCWQQGKSTGEKRDEQSEAMEGCCGWGEHMGFHRQFMPREDRIKGLEEYLKQVQAEAKGVEERIAEMKKTAQK